ncbi:MAG: shikimate kinase [Desulfotignum sp.]
MPCNLILIGYRCCGKTRVGRHLADLTGYDFVDTDAQIESDCGADIDALVTEKGWPFFRQAETRILTHLLCQTNQVIATGGGMVLAPENRILIKKNGFVIWLTADPATIVQRLEADPQTLSQRPRLTARSLGDETRQALAKRIPLYEDLSDMTVDTTTGHSPREIAAIIKRRLDHVRI